MAYSIHMTEETRFSRPLLLPTSLIGSRRVNTLQCSGKTTMIGKVSIFENDISNNKKQDGSLPCLVWMFSTTEVRQELFDIDSQMHAHSCKCLAYTLAIGKSTKYITTISGFSIVYTLQFSLYTDMISVWLEKCTWSVNNFNSSALYNIQLPF
jgi:hypothetical protein